ncbi:hypothetical protein Tco_1267421 [Tanacetum coccineum]
MEVGTTTNNLTARLPIFNPGDYDLWLMRIEQYFLMTDYSLWEVIKYGNKVLRRIVQLNKSMNPSLLNKNRIKEMRMITRAYGSASYHGNIQAFLRRLDIEDLNLRMIFDPDEKDDIWMNQLYWKLLKWKLHENCGVHTLFMDGTPMQINMLVEKKYPLIKDLLEKMLNLQLEAEEESTMAFELLKFIKSQIEEQ